MSQSSFANECVAAMNEYRSIHQVEPLSYNREIEQVAQKWADKLAKINTSKHNENATYKGEKMGENIAYGWSNKKIDISGKHVAEMWYSEIKSYDFNSYSGTKTGHFTQLVWKDSKEVGVGLSKTNDGAWYVVADFYPPGNYVGKHPTNVFPTKDGKIPPLTDDTELNLVDDSPAGSIKRQEHPETQGREQNTVTTTTTTETVTTSDGSTVTTVTEKTQGPGPLIKIKVTETRVRPDGSKFTKTQQSEMSL